MLFRLQPQNLGCHMLQRAQQLSFAIKQQLSVRALALYVDVAPFKPVWICCSCACRNAKLQAA